MFQALRHSFIHHMTDFYHNDLRDGQTEALNKRDLPKKITLSEQTRGQFLLQIQNRLHFSKVLFIKHENLFPCSHMLNLH